MKKYTKPTMEFYNVQTKKMMATSTGVETGNGLGDEYNLEDESYSKADNIWDKEW